MLLSVITCIENHNNVKLSLNKKISIRGVF